MLLEFVPIYNQKEKNEIIPASDMYTFIHLSTTGRMQHKVNFSVVWI